MSDFFNKYGPSIRVLLPHIVLIVILVVLYTVLAKTGYGRISVKYREFTSAKSEEEQLENKLASLKEIDVTTLGKTEKTVIALPEENAATFAIAQVRRLATDNAIVLTKIESGSAPSAAQLPSAGIDIEGSVESSDVNAILSFVQALDGVAPIISPKKIEIERSLTGIGMTMEFVSYWSPLPTTLPKVTEPLDGLTADEETLLDLVSGLTEPEFGEYTAQPLTTRENPFN